MDIVEKCRIESSIYYSLCSIVLYLAIRLCGKLKRIIEINNFYVVVVKHSGKQTLKHLTRI